MAAAQRPGRPTVAAQSDKKRLTSAARPDGGGGNGRTAERQPAARRAPATTTQLESPGTSQPATFDWLLRATSAIGAAGSVPEVAEMLRAEVRRVLPGIDCKIDVRLGKTKTSRRLRDANAGATPGAAQPESGDAFAEKALQRRRLACRRRDGSVRLVIPLLSRNEPWGHVDVRSRGSSLPGEEQSAYLQLLANSAASVLENACLRRSAGNQAMTDSVTGFYSGWHFHERLCSETARARRYGQPLSAILFEVDDFDEFVEDRGQAQGTYLLRAVSRLLKGSMRHKVDLAYRCGGARFALLLPNTPCSKDGAVLVAERMRGMLEVTDFRTGDDEYLGRFTLSAGVAGIPTQCDDADELAAAAEEALCEAMSAGKNRVKIYRE